MSSKEPCKGCSEGARLRDSSARAWVAFGERDDIGLTDEERRELEASPGVT